MLTTKQNRVASEIWAVLDAGAERSTPKNMQVDKQYMVPMLLKAIRILSALHEHPPGLKIEQIYDLTGYPKSSIYRIVRTLIVCKCVSRKHDGSYSVATPADGVKIFRPMQQISMNGDHHRVGRL